MSKYDANVRLNITAEYSGPEDVAPADVKEDLRAAFQSFDVWIGELHVWVAEVDSTGRPTRFE